MAGTPRRSKRSAARAGALLQSTTVRACSGGTTWEPVPTKFECPTSTVVLWFWPEGHPPIASINAPEAPEPHVETTFDDLAVFYLDANGVFNRGPAPCDDSWASMPDDRVDDGVEERSAHTLTCTPGTEAVIWRSDPTEEPVTMTIAAGDSIVAGVTLAPDDPTLSYRPQDAP